MKTRYSKQTSYRNRKKTWAEKLEDPRWIQLSDEIRNERGECLECGSSRNLQVHHAGYIDFVKEPWEYDGADLVVLCRDCHEALHYWADSIWNNILKLDVHQVGDLEELFNDLIALSRENWSRVDLAILRFRQGIHEPYKNRTCHRLMKIFMKIPNGFDDDDTKQNSD